MSKIGFKNLKLKPKWPGSNLELSKSKMYPNPRKVTQPRTGAGSGSWPFDERVVLVRLRSLPPPIDFRFTVRAPGGGGGASGSRGSEVMASDTKKFESYILAVKLEPSISLQEAPAKTCAV